MASHAARALPHLSHLAFAPPGDAAMQHLNLLLLVGGLLATLSLVAGLYSRRIGVSQLLVFLMLGMGGHAGRGGRAAGP